MGLFQEYLDSKGKIRKPVVDASGDQIDPTTSPNAPPKGKPYKGTGGKPDSSKGFGDQGDSSLKYQPCKDEKSKPKAAKIPTAEQAEICALTTDAMRNDMSMVVEFIAQAKSKGLVGPLVAELFQHKVALEQLSELMAHESYGPRLCNKLARIMEEVAPPFSDSILQKDEDGPEDTDDVEEDDDLDLGDEEEGEEGDIDPNMPPEGMAPGGPVGPDGMPMDPNMMGQPMMGPDGMPMDPNMMGQQPPMGAPPMNPAMMNMRKAMKRFMDKNPVQPPAPVDQSQKRQGFLPVNNQFVSRKDNPPF